MPRIRFGDHRVARRDRAGEIAPRRRIEREREIVRTEHRDRAAEWSQLRANIGFAIDGRAAPRPVARRCCRLSQLIGRARQFGLAQPRFCGQSRFPMRHRNQRVGVVLDVRSVGFEEFGDLRAADPAQRSHRLLRRLQRKLDIRRAGDRIAVLKRRLRAGIDGMKRACWLGCVTPRPINQYRL